MNTSALIEVCDEILWDWSLELLEVIFSFSSRVCKVGLSDGSIGFLKVSDSESAARELFALSHFVGPETVKVIRSSVNKGAILTEWIAPGQNLLPHFLEGRDGVATKICASVITSLHSGRPEINSPVHSIAAVARKRLSLALGNSGPTKKWLNVEQLENALHIVSDFDRPQDQTFLHGDLHHANILTAGNGQFVCIDPKGIMGDLAFEAAAWLVNPWDEIQKLVDPKALIDDRLAIFEKELGIDRRRLKKAAYIKTILSTLWAIEDIHESQKGFARLISVFE